MENYLQLCRSNLSNLNQFESIFIVIGNESCDLDSAISAIVLAYIKYHESLSKSVSAFDETIEDVKESKYFAFPILNVPRSDLKLRKEIVFWFEQVLQFDLKNLICRDEIDYLLLNSSSATIKISLVDHNENKEIARLIPKGLFDEIVDHHQPTYLDDACQVKDTSKVTLDTTVGSCSSLVALRFLSCSILSQFTKKEICNDSQIALMLYGPILLDTICFNHTAKRFNAKDYEAINKLEDLLKHTSDAESSLFDRNDVYQRLVDARNSHDGLTFDELLRKDMKIVESLSDNNLAVCLSAITGTKLTEFSLKDRLNELQTFCNNPPSSVIFSELRPRLFNALVLLSVDDRIPNNLQRQLALYCVNKHLMRTIATCIERNSELELELITASETLRIYNQNNLTATRKMVLPIISTILNGPGSQRPEENAKPRCDSVGSSDTHGSAPSSFIQQPDSYYGSYIEDSFVGDFVGEYPTNENDLDHQENILVMDSEGQNLVMMNPNETISHGHEIEFDFDSFGPESIIYAENVETIDGEKPKNNTVENTTTNSTQAHEEHDSLVKVNKENEEDTKQINNNNLSKNIEAKTDSNSTTTPDEISTTLRVSDENEQIVTDDESNAKFQDDLKLATELNVESGTLSDRGRSSNDPVESSIVETDESRKQINENEGKFKVPLGKTELITSNESESIASSSSLSSDSLGTLSPNFSRNSTLTRSQRKKVSPLTNIKNLLMASDTYSPPVLDSSILTSLPQTSDLNKKNNTLNGDKTDQNENFIVSSANSSNTSLANNSKPNENSPSETKDSSFKIIDHPLSLSSNSMNELNGLGGLTRQPSMKKKVPVNYDMLLQNNYDKDEENDKNQTAQVNDIDEDKSSNNQLELDSNGITTQQVLEVANGNGDLSSQHNDDQLVGLGNGEFNRPIDLKVIEPFRKVISLGGYLNTGLESANLPTSQDSNPAIIIFSACYLPHRSRADYHYVMDNLFMYVLSTLHNIIAEDYILIYLHNGGVQNAANNMPTFSWLKRCYQMIDRKLKKNLKALYILHPTFWLKTLIIMSKPFISTKFSRKLKFVRSLEELRAMIPIEHVAIPELVKM